MTSGLGSKVGVVTTTRQVPKSFQQKTTEETP
jgi:hypothetical protein